MHSSLATKLRVLRAERGLTVRQAAELSGVAKETISQVERGERHPYDRTLAKLAVAYDIPVKELLASEAEEPEAALAGSSPKAEAQPDTGRLPKWAEASDIGAFAQKLSKVSPEELRNLADAVSAVPVRSPEDLRLPHHEDAGMERVLNIARSLALHRAFVTRSIQPPRSFTLAYRRHVDALADEVESETEADHGTVEAG